MSDIETPTENPAEIQAAENLQRLWAVITALDLTTSDRQNLDASLALMDIDDIGRVFESVPEDLRLVLWEHLQPQQFWPLLHTLQYDTVRFFVAALDIDQQVKLQVLAGAADLLELAESLPAPMVKAILASLDPDTADSLRQTLAYDDEQIGRSLSKQIIRVRANTRAGSIIKRLHRRGDIKAIFVVDSNGDLLGHIPLHEVFLSEPATTAEELAEPLPALDHQSTHFEAIRAIDTDCDANWYPVVRNGKVIGAFATNTLLWELQESLVDAETHDAPAAEEDLFTPVMVAARLRALWLGINLATAFLASWVIGIFEGAIHEMVALAVLMPVVASMGGIGGSQTLSVALRGLALNHLTNANIKLLLRKEAHIALLNGVILGAVIAGVVWYWFDSFGLGLIIFIAIAINSLAAATSGTFIPFILKKLRIDPAIAGSVILTTVTDVVGYMVFLGLGSLLIIGNQ